MHVTILSVPDKKLHHRRTFWQQSRQSNQALHWRAAVIEAEWRQEHEQSHLFMDVEHNNCTWLSETNTTKICSLISQIQSYMILLVTLIFGRNSVSVLRISTSHWPPDKLQWTHTYSTIKIKYSICMMTDWRDWQECDWCEVAYSTYSRTEMTGQLANDFATFCISGLVHFWFNRLIKTNKKTNK